MLDDENDIENDWKKAEAKFCRRSEYWRPVIKIVGQQEKLQKTERAACKVQQHIDDTPTSSGFSFEIHERLRKSKFHGVYNKPCF